MDWKRERDGLVVVVGVGVVIGAVVVGGSVGRFASTLVATFLGVLVALRVDDRLGGTVTGRGAPVPATEADAATTARERTRNEPAVTATEGSSETAGDTGGRDRGSDGADAEDDEGGTADATDAGDRT